MRVDLWSKATLKSILPGGVLLLAVATLANLGWLTLALPTLTFLYYASFTVGLLLAWRFHSSRVFFALLVLLLAQQSITVFSVRPPVVGGNGAAAVAAVAILFPLNFVLLSLERERGFTQSGVATRILFLLAQVVVVFILGHIESVPARSSHHPVALAPLPGYVWFTFGGAAIFLFARFLLFRKPVESALIWSLGAFFLATHVASTARMATAYFGASALILAASIVETSYVLAYHDELTTLPSRRAFNDALQRIQVPYSIAIVDIDHFKKFNDTYGHDTGDEVLRLVASKLGRVTGGGEAYRCGGEEFAIVFSGKTTPEVADHLEQLRASIEAATFRMRGDDRRQAARGPDRRNQSARSRGSTGRAIRQLTQEPLKSRPELSVTVSIGVATSAKDKTDAEQVIGAADKALYRAKAAGRNRVETADAPRRRARVKTAGIA